MTQSEVVSGCRPIDKYYQISAGLGKKGPKWGTEGHQGIDFACPKGTPVLAFEDGLVEKIWECHETLGLAIRLRHKNFNTLYAHLLGKMVKVGDKVKRGEMIGASGNSGLSYSTSGGDGSHLHFAVKTILDNKSIPCEFEDV